MSEQPPFIVVDGSSYLHRAFHAVPSMTNSHGLQTGAIHGVVMMLQKLLRTYKPTHAVVTFDASRRTFRNDIYADYKAERPPTPEELKQQIEPLYEIVRAMGLPLLVIEGVEADDVIGTLAVQATALEMTTLISTGDKDIAQLVNEHVTLINTMSKTTTDVAACLDKYGVPPRKIIDYLALMGDKSDGIPGVPGVGSKTAAKLINRFGSLEEVIAGAGEVTGKLGEKLRANLDFLPTGYRLATIKTDVALDYGPQDLLFEGVDVDTLNQLFRQLDFDPSTSRLLESLPNRAANSTAETAATAAADSEPETIDDEVIDDKPTIDCDIIFTDEAFLQQMRALAHCDNLHMLVKTDEQPYRNSQLAGVGLSAPGMTPIYIPLGHHYLGVQKQVDSGVFRQGLSELLLATNAKIITFDAKSAHHALINAGVRFKGFDHDVVLQAYHLDPTRSYADLNKLSRAILDCDAPDMTLIAGQGRKRRSFEKLQIEKVAPLVAEELGLIETLHTTLYPKITESDLGLSLYTEVDMALTPVLTKMERNGVAIDSDKLTAQSADLQTRINDIEQQAYALVGEFNLSSPKQLAVMLYDKQDCPIIKKTAKGQPSTNEEVLQELADQGHELPQLIMVHRSLSKLRSTYTEPLPALVNSQTQRLHTTLHQAVTATGRLSSSNPNLQNIPIKSEEGKKIRQAFIAPEGHVLLAADYSQIELRIMAHLSQDERLIAAFSAGEDIHRQTAADIFAVELDAVTDEQRRNAKAINFGLIYGMSAHGLAKQLGIERSAASSYIKTYFERYPGVKAYMEQVVIKAKEDGYVETVAGRKLRLPDINASRSALRKYAERTAINAPMQGTASDIIKTAMIRLQRALYSEHRDVKMTLQVHDELVFEVPDHKIDAITALVNKEMADAGDLSVPLVVECGQGLNWQQAH